MTITNILFTVLVIYNAYKGNAIESRFCNFGTSKFNDSESALQNWSLMSVPVKRIRNHDTCNTMWYLWCTCFCIW